MDRAEALRALEEERERGVAALAGAADLEALEAARTAVMGRKSRFGELQRSLGSMAEEDRRTVCAVANEVREVLQAAAAERLSALRAVRTRHTLRTGRAVDAVEAGVTLRALRTRRAL